MIILSNSAARAAGGYLSKQCPQAHALFRTCNSIPHFGHFFVHTVDLVLPVSIFFLTGFFPILYRRLIAASAWPTAHWGWIPLLEYDRFPQTGQVRLTNSSIKGVGFLIFISLHQSPSAGRSKQYPSRKANRASQESRPKHNSS
jgi:hypothetical protein